MRRTSLGTALGLVAATTVTLTGPVLAAAPTCGGRPATIVGTAGDDVLVGTRGPDVVVGLAGADQLRGRGGDDLLCGGPGRDVLRGGAGADLLDVGPDDGGEPDVITYDTASRGVQVDLRLPRVQGQGRDELVGDRFALHGSPYDDELVGNEATIALVGLGGDDRITGSVGSDWIYGDGLRPNRLSGDDELYGVAGADYLHPGRGDDVVFGGTGDDYAYAWEDQPSGSDLVHGGPGHDWIEDVAGPGDRDDYRAGRGRDTLWLRTRFVRDGRVTHPNGRMNLDGRWTTYGDQGAEGRVRDFERVILPVGRWRLLGTDADETLWAPRGVSDPLRRGVTILGAGGDDNIIGTEYDDVLRGGDGSDLVCGRGGDDEIEAEAQAVDPIDLCDPR